MNTREFLDIIYQEETGYCYVATKDPVNDQDFTRQFFDWPAEKDYALAYIAKQQETREVYYAPSLFRTKSSRKTEVKGARVYWVEFDGNLPKELGEIPEPNIKLQSSEPGHEHWYWLIDKLATSKELDTINRALTYVLGADVSGWDASQILRPVGSKHWLSGATVELLAYDPTPRAISGPVGAVEAPPTLDIIDESLLPKLTTVLQVNSLPTATMSLFEKGSGDRSQGLMALGYQLAEQGVSVEEMLVLLLDADLRWGKFAHREDRLTRLSEIIVKSKLKYPEPETQAIVSFTLDALLDAKVEFEWLWENFLPKQGYFLLVGPSGIGKTQLSLNAMMNFACGKTFLGTPVKRPMRVGIFSLEMNLMELKRLVEIQIKSYSKDEQKEITENVRFYPVGEPLSLQLADERTKVENIIEADNLEGVFIDSLGSMTEEDLSSERIKGMMNWNDRIRQRYGVFTWLVHHQRKANGDNKKPNKLADVYGSMFITRNVTTCLCLWRGIGIEVHTLKNRFAEEQSAFPIIRQGDLTFIRGKDGEGLFTPGEPVVQTGEDGKTLIKGLNFK